LRLEMRAEIRRIHRELGRTTIYVTHDQDEALSLSDRIVVMRQGIAQQIAPPKVVFEMPSNLHVARFMGYRNVLDLDVAARESQRARVLGPGIELWGTVAEPFTGTRASVAIRPDEMTVVAPGSPNSLAATVVSSEYGGRDSLVEVLAASGTRLYVRTSQHVNPGDTISISAPPERVLVYPVEAPATTAPVRPN
ncbi:MAG TPA: TOBE domain-containing protein, partial [Polyangiaceae bacterium]|nr:TOBE domain-containing protein [Polyangiaceae bacterium]